MSEQKVLAFDLETVRLASEVERDHAGELAGESPWSRPDLFGFGVGVAVDLNSGEARRYGPDEASRMISDLSEAATTVEYNTAAFDLLVLSPHGDVEGLRVRHVDLCAIVRSSLDEHPAAASGQRVGQGGLDGLCSANSLAVKTGDVASASALLREGRVEEVMAYCESDVRLVVGLYEIAIKTGKLRVEPYVHNDRRERVYMEPVEVPVSVAVG